MHAADDLFPAFSPPLNGEGGLGFMVVSGGQTGVDQGALDAALDAGFPCGGWCPEDRRNERGTIPARYPLKELKFGGYRARTFRNLMDAGGTLILYSGELEGGTALTASWCIREKRPFRLVDAGHTSAEDAAALAWDFVRSCSLHTLNVAGPRESRWPEAHAYAHGVVKGLLGKMGQDMRRSG